MPPLPDGTYHPHVVTITPSDDNLLNLVVKAVPPEGSPFMVMGCGLSTGGDLTAKVNELIASLGLKVGPWSATIDILGPPGLTLAMMRLTAPTEEL